MDDDQVAQELRRQTDMTWHDGFYTGALTMIILALIFALILFVASVVL